MKNRWMNCSRKRKVTVLDDLEAMKKITRKHKTSQRKSSAAIAISQSTIGRTVRVSALKRSRIHTLFLPTDIGLTESCTPYSILKSCSSLTVWTEDSSLS